MKGKRAVALALVVGMAGCSELATTPQQTVDLAPSYGRVDNPPPPPADLEAVGTFFPDGGSETASLAPNVVGNISGDFVLNVSYLFNKPGNSGWVHFDKQQDENVNIPNGAQVKMSQDVFSGKGIVEVTLGASLLIFDLASVLQAPASWFASCGPAAPPAPSVANAVPRPEGGCFTLTFEDATLDGVPGSVLLQAQCTVDDPRPICNFIPED